MNKTLPRFLIGFSLLTLLVSGNSAFALLPNGQSSDQKIIEFIQNHPGEFEAIDRMSLALFGENYWVKLPDLPTEVTGTQAEAHIESLPSGRATRAALPLDTFVVTVGRASVSGGIYVTGSVVFKLTNAGQSDPDDIGSLQFAIPPCMAPTNHTIRTYSGSGASTGFGYLSNPNLAKDSPIWRISDRTSGFVNQAQRSSASVLLIKSGCSGTSTVQTAYVYEHNQSGLIRSISSSFGRLSVAYDVPTLTLRKSSTVMTFNW